MVETLLYDWAVPRMGVRKMIGAAFVSNEGSGGVLRKSGFVYRETYPDFAEIKGIMRSLVVYDWEYTARQV